MCCLAAVSARKIIIGTPGDPFAEFKNDHDVLIREDDPNRVSVQYNPINLWLLKLIND